MARTYADLFSQLVDRRYLEVAVTQCLKCLCSELCVLPGKIFVQRFASHTGSKAFLLSLGGRRKERNILRLRSSRGARRPAENAGRSHAEEKQPIERSILFPDGQPSPVVHSARF